MALSPTANQGARPHPDAARAQRATPVRTPGNSSHYSFQGQDVPTSGGVADTKHGELDNKRQGPTKLYLGKAVGGSAVARPVKKTGNSTGIVKAAKARLSRGKNSADAKAKTKLPAGQYGGLPFRREGPAFGPVRDSVRKQYAQGSRTRD